MVIPAVPAVIGRLLLVLPPRGPWLTIVGFVLIFPFDLWMIASFAWSNEPANGPALRLHQSIDTLLGISGFLVVGATVASIVQAVMSSGADPSASHER